jgi:hypothetical protein
MVHVHRHSSFSYTSSMDCFKVVQTPVHIQKLFPLVHVLHPYLSIYIHIYQISIKNFIEEEEREGWRGLELVPRRRVSKTIMTQTYDMNTDILKCP